ncbi:MAG TPA: YfcE family phosphodiesterase [Desulfobulbaceae bacterium]|nr:YfcE family phosphodiesterase [Desulfobulbaceae bacterium]
MTIKAGILSDTHRTEADLRFRRLIERCFSDCAMIIHAGDLTDISILDAFADKTVYAVHGNMCRGKAQHILPRATTFSLGGFTIGLTHGAGLGHDIEAALWDLFPDVDCVIYGHTHQPVLHRQAGRLIINPGSFKATSRWGAPGTFAVLEAGDPLPGAIAEVPNQP